LPALLTACEERWNLTLGATFSNLSFNYVAPAIRADGTPVIVKVGLPDEFPSQPEALQYFAGHGMARLLAYDEQNNMMLFFYNSFCTFYISQTFMLGIKVCEM